MKAHPTAIIDSKAKIACSVTVGAYSVIGPGVELGEDCEVLSHVVLGGPTRMGKGNRIFPYASIGLQPQDLKYGGEPTGLEVGDENIFREFVTVHRGTAEGGGVTRIGSQQQQVFRIGLVASVPQDYQPKERMSYFAQPAK